jgi:hypothetical protein
MAFERESGSDVAWLAFRYVAGELGPDEADAFERRLDQDQAAREAVAEAVLLTEAVAALAPDTLATLPLQVPTPIDRRGRLARRMAGALALAAAACLAWFLFGPRTVRPSRPPADVVERERAAPAASREALVTLAWSEVRQKWDGAESGVAEELPEAEGGSFAEPEDAADHGLPPWLLDAVTLAGRPGPVANPVEER